MRLCLSCMVALMILLPHGPVRGDGWDRLREDAGLIKTIQADFVQTKALKILAAPLVSTGQFVFRAPGSVRWEYTSPIQVITLVTPGRVRRFTHTDELGWVSDSTGSLQAMQIVMEKITGWLSGNFTDDELFNAELQEGPPIVVVLTPRDEAMARFLQRVEVVFSAVPGLVEVVRLHEGPGATTTITFKQTHLNDDIPDAQFKDVK